jgi:hypothetical protein
MNITPPFTLNKIDRESPPNFFGGCRQHLTQVVTHYLIALRLWRTSRRRSHGTGLMRRKSELSMNRKIQLSYIERRLGLALELEFGFD